MHEMRKVRGVSLASVLHGDPLNPTATDEGHERGTTNLEVAGSLPSPGLLPP